MATFARSRGAISEKSDFGIFVEKALPAEEVIAVHPKGDAIFESIGLDYPVGYVDIDISYWRKLTGEED